MAHRSGAAFNYWEGLVAGRGAWGLATRAGLYFYRLPGYVFEAATGLESRGGAGFLFLAALVWGAWRYGRRGWRLVLVYCGAYVLLGSLGEEPLPRYVIPLLPFVFLFVVEAAVGAVSALRLRSRRAGTIAQGVVHVLAGLLVLSNVLPVGRTIFRVHSDDFYSVYDGGQWADYFELAGRLEGHRPEGRLMADRMRVVHFLTGIPTARGPTRWWPGDIPAEPASRSVRAARAGAAPGGGASGSRSTGAAAEEAGSRSAPTTGAPAVATEELARRVEEAGATAVLVDPAEEESARLLERLVEETQGWRLRLSAGRLLLYEHSGEQGHAAGPPESSSEASP